MNKELLRFSENVWMAEDRITSSNSFELVCCREHRFTVTRAHKEFPEHLITQYINNWCGRKCPLLFTHGGSLFPVIGKNWTGGFLVWIINLMM